MRTGWRVALPAEEGYFVDELLLQQLQQSWQAKINFYTCQIRFLTLLYILLTSDFSPSQKS